MFLAVNGERNVARIVIVYRALRDAATWLALTAVAVAAGFGLYWIVLPGLNAVLPPFRADVDNSSPREFVPAVLARGTWGLTSVIGAVLAWRWVGRPRSA